MQRAFEASRATLREVHLRRQGLDTQEQLLRLETAPRDLEDQSLQDLVVERVPLGLTPLTFGFAQSGRLIQLGLRVERRDQRIRIEEQFEQRIQQSPNEA